MYKQRVTQKGFIQHSCMSAGFTLIELLVVIAIIGILSAVVLASLSAARNKGNDAKVQTQLRNIQTAAEVYNHSNDGYGTDADCAAGGMGLDATTGLTNLMAAANWPDGVAPTCSTDSDGVAEGTKFSAYHALLSSSNFWCVDSGGISKEEDSSWTAPSAGDPCP